MQQENLSKDNEPLATRVIIGARNYGIGSVLFRHAVGTKLGVNATDMECLGVIFFKGIATPKELSEYTGLSSGATTAMLDRLEKSGMVERHPNPNDRRSTLIVVVKKAAKKIEPLFRSVRKAQEAIVSSYSEEELKIIDDFFQKSAQMWEQERKKLGG